MPAELLDKIEHTMRFQRQLFIPDKILKGRPMTTDKAKSRFNGQSSLVHQSLQMSRNMRGLNYATGQHIPAQFVNLDNQGYTT